jgi:hypothetical protein
MKRNISFVKNGKTQHRNEKKRIKTPKGKMKRKLHKRKKKEKKNKRTTI